ncbi:MAG: hypothetical protein AAF628_02550 [Planctomycetota bacterium]
MSAPELTRDLVDALAAETSALDQLRQAMVERRVEFAALRASTCDRALHNMALRATAVGTAAARRESAAADLATALQVRGSMSVCKILARLPEDARPQLQAARDAARRAAIAVRAEARLGARLAENAKHSRTSVLRALGATQDEVPVYDRNARRVGTSPVGGVIVRGTV